MQLFGTTIIATAPCCVASRASNVPLAALLQSFFPQVAAGVPGNAMISLLLGFSSWSTLASLSRQGCAKARRKSQAYARVSHFALLELGPPRSTALVLVLSLLFFLVLGWPLAFFQSSSTVYVKSVSMKVLSVTRRHVNAFSGK
eukprot:4463384-Amphidinium_carterae.1